MYQTEKGMKTHIVSRHKDELLPGVMVAMISLLGAVIARFFPALLGMIPACSFREWTGIPCPTCGATRAGYHLLHLHWGQAIIYNPLFVLIYLILAFWGVNTISGLLFGKNIYFHLNDREKVWVRRFVLFAIPVNWLILISLNI
ncbi:DUF2752 domain-containing protein [candidate division KSB1 bacterium]|nr:DUF2752 domain-containing protein [candidate division KSB1 bacterium]